MLFTPHDILYEYVDAQNDILSILPIVPLGHIASPKFITLTLCISIIAAKDHNYNMNSDCFVCAILTHGEEGYVFGVDAKIETKQLLEPFKGNNCGSLVGKPKIFIIQVWIEHLLYCLVKC